MPEETIVAFQDHGEVAADARRRTSTRRAKLLERARARPASTTTTSSTTLEARGRAEVRRLVRTSCSTGSARSAASSPRRDRRARELVERIWARDATRLDRRRRGTVARLARRAAADAGARRRARPSSPEARDESSTTFVLLGMGGSSLAPEVLRRTFGVEPLPRARHDAPGGDPRSWSESLDLERDALRRLLEVGDDARDALALDYFWEQTGERGAVRRGHRSRLGARAARARARLPRRLRTASRRSAAATRRCRRSGSCPAALMGVDVDAPARRAPSEMADACRSDDGNPGLELGLAARRRLAARAATRCCIDETRRASGSGSSS